MLAVPSPWPQSEMNEFLETYFYATEAFFIDEINSAHPNTGEIFATCRAHTNWIMSSRQRGRTDWHPRHISGGDLIMVTATLGSLHAYFFHSCKWKDGWIGFGSRIENAEFHKLGRVDLPLELHSKEIKQRCGAKRTLISFEFQFSQEGKLIYSSQQTALLVKSEHRIQ
jgi:hypothetical protein